MKRTICNFMNQYPETLDELGERLYAKITEVVIPEWPAAFQGLILQDCKD